MRRRDFLPLAAAAITWSPASAEIPAARIGFIHSGARQENQAFLDAFREGLALHGWVAGSNVAILDRWAEDRTERLPGIITEVMSNGVAVLVTAGTAATLAAKHRSATTPIVFVGVDDPIAIGVAESLGRPGGNVTGLALTSSELIANRLQLLREIVPTLHRLSVVVRDDPGLEQKLREIYRLAEHMGIVALMLEATTSSALEFSFTRLRGEHCEAVYVASGPLGPAKRLTIVSLAAEAKLPTIYSFRVFPIDGGLISLGANYRDLFRRAAGYVDMILEGAAPGDLPIEQPRSVELVVNIATAKRLGLTFPPSILARADQVIE